MMGFGIAKLTAKLPLALALVHKVYGCSLKWTIVIVSGPSHFNFSQLFHVISTSNEGKLDEHHDTETADALVRL